MLEVRLLVENPQNWTRAIALGSARFKVMDVEPESLTGARQRFEPCGLEPSLADLVKTMAPQLGGRRLFVLKSRKRLLVV